MPAQRIRAFLRCFLTSVFFALRAFLRIRFNVRCFLRQFFFALRAFFCGGPVPHAPTPLRGFMACVLAWVFFVFYVSFSLRFARFLCASRVFFALRAFSLRFARFLCSKRLEIKRKFHPIPNDLLHHNTLRPKRIQKRFDCRLVQTRPTRKRPDI